MIVLGLDTCLTACSVAITDGDRVLAHDSAVMARGHQEQLAPMAQRTAQAAGLSFDRLERIGVTVGPGSFTGLRVGLAFAKGLGLALDVPVAGVGALEALAAAAEGLVFAAIDARREQLYLQVFDAGRALAPPAVLPLATAAAQVAKLAAGRRCTLIGSGALLLAEAAPGAIIRPVEGADARCVARLASRPDPGLPKPLYLRAPDARLPA